MYSDGDVAVRYSELNKQWCFNSIVLESIHPFSIGKAVRIRYDENTIKQIHEEKPELTIQLQELLGRFDSQSVWLIFLSLLFF